VEIFLIEAKKISVNIFINENNKKWVTNYTQIK
jgi:hypothetical protein